MSQNLVNILKIDTKDFNGKQISDFAEGIEDVRRRVWLTTYPNEKCNITKEDIKNSFAPLEESVDRMKNAIYNEKDMHTFIALSEERVVGFCIGDKDSVNKIGATYILDDFQGKGIGTRLLSSAINFLGKNEDIYLEVAQYNEKAIGFYKKLGFTIFDEDVYPLFRLNPPKKIPIYKMVRKGVTLS